MGGGVSPHTTPPLPMSPGCPQPVPRLVPAAHPAVPQLFGEEDDGPTLLPWDAAAGRGCEPGVGGTHSDPGVSPPCPRHPKTHPLERAGAGLLPRGCVVTVPILLGHTARGDGGDPPPQKSHTHPTPQHGETEAGAGGGTWVAQSCRHRGLGCIPDTRIRTWASRQHWGQQGGHVGTPGSQPSAGPLQGKLRHRAGWGLTSGASPGGCRLSPRSHPGCRRPGPGSPTEPPCHQGCHRGCHCPQWRRRSGGPHLRAWRGRGSWSPHRTWGRTGDIWPRQRGQGWGQGGLGDRNGTGTGMETGCDGDSNGDRERAGWPWGQGWMGMRWEQGGLGDSNGDRHRTG